MRDGSVLVVLVEYNDIVLYKRDLHVVLVEYNKREIHVALMQQQNELMFC